MIASPRTPRRHSRACRWNDRFLELLPTIRDQAEYAFRRAPREARAELVQEVVAAAYALFISLCRRGKAALIYPTPICKFAIGHVRAGRRTGSRFNSRDLTSPGSRASKQLVIERLDQFDRRKGGWREIVVEDRTAGPAEIVETQLDFESWLRSLSTRDRRIAETLAIGESTNHVARIFQLTAARVSQLRRELRANWRRFVGELTDAGAVAATVRS